MKVYIGADHGGFKLKERLRRYLKEKGYDVADFGNTQFDPRDDYPDFALPVARQVARDSASRGILICRSGVGVNIVANRIRGIFAVLTQNVKLLKMVRSHENVNVLCLASDFTTLPQAKKLVDVFLQARFSGARRHRRRLDKIARIR